MKNEQNKQNGCKREFGVDSGIDNPISSYLDPNNKHHPILFKSSNSVLPSYSQTNTTSQIQTKSIRSESLQSVLLSTDKNLHDTYIILPTQIESFEGKQYVITLQDSSLNGNNNENHSFFALHRLTIDGNNGESVDGNSKMVLLQPSIPNIPNLENLQITNEDSEQGGKFVKMAVSNNAFSLPPLGCTSDLNDKRGDITNPKKRFSTEPRTCLTCGKAFKYPSDLRKHEQVHNEIRKFNCDDCGRSFRRLHQLNVHKRIHTGEKPYVCSECGMSFRHDSTLTMHFRTRHQHLRPFQCGICNKLFGRLSHLRKHQKYVCNAICQSSIYKTNQSTSRVFQCDFCGLVFDDEVSCQEHRNTCTEHMPGFHGNHNHANSSYIIGHVLSDSLPNRDQRMSTNEGSTGDFFACSFCESIFHNYTDFSNHLSKHVHNILPPDSNTEEVIHDPSNIFRLMGIENDMSLHAGHFLSSERNIDENLEYDSRSNSFYGTNSFNELVGDGIFSYDEAPLYIQGSDHSDNAAPSYEKESNSEESRDL